MNDRTTFSFEPMLCESAKISARRPRMALRAEARRLPRNRPQVRSERPALVAPTRRNFHLPSFISELPTDTEAPIVAPAMVRASYNGARLGKHNSSTQKGKTRAMADISLRSGDILARVEPRNRAQGVELRMTGRK